MQSTNKRNMVKSDVHGTPVTVLHPGDIIVVENNKCQSYIALRKLQMSKLQSAQKITKANEGEYDFFTGIRWRTRKPHPHPPI